MKARGIGHIHLHVRDLERSIAFYRDAFGLRERFRLRGTIVFLGPIVVHGDGSPEAGKSGGIDHFGLDLGEERDLDDAIDGVLAAGGRLVERGERAAGIDYAHVTDPDGYRIEV